MELAGRRCLITGGAGFVGRALAEQVRVRDAVVQVLDRPGTGADLEVDLTQTAALALAVRAARPDLVFHLAAVTRIPAGGEAAAWAVNVAGTANLLAALDGLPAPVVLVSSAEVYGDAPLPYAETASPRPRSAYGISKLAAEQLLTLAADRGRAAVIVRPTVIYGPGQPPVMLVPELAGRARRNEALVTTRGGQQRDLLYVDDAAAGMVAAVRAAGTACPVFNLGGGVTATVAEIVAELRRLTGHTAAWRRDLPYRAHEVMAYAVSVTAAAEQLGWRARVDWREGLRRTVAAA